MQTELLEKLQEANRSGFDRMQTEASLASEFAAKLMQLARSPRPAIAYQEWARRRMEMATEGAKHLLVDTHKVMKTGVRLLSDSWLSNRKPP